MSGNVGKPVPSWEDEDTAIVILEAAEIRPPAARARRATLPYGARFAPARVSVRVVG